MPEPDALAPLPERPLISVIVPSYNQGDFIRQTIDSCLRQDYRPIEILVVDGASTDGTIEVLRSFGNIPELRWVSEPDSGPVEAVNKGLAWAKGCIGLIQSADDLSAPGAFGKVAAVFCKQPGVGLVYGDCEVVDASGEVLFVNRVGRYTLARLLSRQIYIPQPCAFFRLDLGRRLGGWDARFPYCPDTELWFKIALNSGVRHLPEILGSARRHASQRDRQRDLILDGYRRMVSESDYLTRLPRALRNAVKAGECQLQLRYGADGAKVAGALWRAVWLHPPLLFSRSIPKHALVPGYFAMAGSIGRMRRRIRGALPFSSARLIVGRHVLAWRSYRQDRRRYAAFPAGPPIFVTGSPRSGTTWVAAMLATPGVWYLHEPFNPNKHMWKESFTYVPREGCNLGVDRLIRRIVSGGCRQALQVPHASRPLMPLRLFSRRVQRLLIKDPLACLMADYIAESLGSQTVVLFRHPAGFVRSYLDLGWPSAQFLRQFLSNSALVQGPLAAHVKALHDHSEVDSLESVALLYGCLCRVLWEFCSRNPAVIVLRFEDLAADPMGQFRELFHRLNLPYTEDVVRMHLSLTGAVQGLKDQGGPHSVHRKSRDMADKWQGTFSDSELSRIQALWTAFGVPLYRDDAMWPQIRKGLSNQSPGGEGH